MDFFEAQAHAKRRTNRLVALFVFAVLGTIVVSYFATIFFIHEAQGRTSHRRSYYYTSPDYDNAPSPELSLWQPNVFAGVALATLVVVGCASLYKWNLYHQGGNVVAESVGGRRVNPNSTDLAERRLLDVVEEMAIAAGVPMPAVYILDDEQAINAFAAGLTTADAVVTVSRGTLDKLTRDELQGVIGHEFSHILNGDMRLNLKLAAIVFGILVIGLAGRAILWSLRNVRVRGKGGGGIAAMALIGLALMIIGYIGYFFGRLIQAAVSRQREFLADASSIQFTRNPAGIGGALKKIGGYALGSSLDTHRAAEIGHFFFAQAFTSSFTGIWDTHPPLDQRIRAIDPQWDGKFLEPPKKVDIAHESFSEIAPPLPMRAAAPTVPLPASPTALSAVASIGMLTSAAITGAQDLLDGLSPRLLAAARDPQQAPALIYGLLLNADATVREQQRGIVATRAGAAALHVLDELAPAIAKVELEHKLPLVQLASPALRQLPPAALAPFFDTLDQLIHVHGQVDTFEFALQKILRRNLALGQRPTGMGQQIFSFEAMANPIDVVLSALAHASSEDERAAAKAFGAGMAQLKMFEGGLPLLAPDACGIKQLDSALDRLAIASLPIKQRLVTAAAHVVSADGVILIGEAELLRAISAALDVPMPPLAKV